ncbi:MAG: hypothetical protein IT196_27615 [Acidimicrobiales bacterium]|nr:hypothetical protein [Acidimicrobiales bacterium]
MGFTVLDPSFEEDAAGFTLPQRPSSLAGATVGIISNGKQNTRPYFDHLERLLRDEWGVAEVVRRTKSNYSAPAEAELIDEAAGWAAMFAGVGD